MAEEIKISLVGSHTHTRIAEPQDCISCHNANWGDVLVNGICGRCLIMCFHTVNGMFEILNLFAVYIEEYSREVDNGEETETTDPE